MEQRIIEQIDKAYEIYISKGAALDERYETLQKEIFTDEIKEMIRLLDQYFIRHMKLDCYVNSAYAKYGKLTFCRKRSFNAELTFGLWVNDDLRPYANYFDKKYTAECISRIQNGIDTLKKSEIIMEILEENAKDLVEYIAKMYKEKTETQAEQMAKILADLDYEDEPIKHIKVTVEWI